MIMIYIFWSSFKSLSRRPLNDSLTTKKKKKSTKKSKLLDNVIKIQELEEIISDKDKIIKVLEENAGLQKKRIEEKNKLISLLEKKEVFADNSDKKSTEK